MDMAYAIWEFLEWVGQYRHWALSAHDDVPDEEVKKAINEFVVRKDQAVGEPTVRDMIGWHAAFTEPPKC